VVVKPGYGLIAQRSGGTEYLVEDSGYRYALGSSPAQSSTTAASGSGSGGQQQQIYATDLLGYHDTHPEQVPTTWLNLVQGGASLVPDLAGQTPQTGN